MRWHAGLPVVGQVRVCTCFQNRLGVLMSLLLLICWSVQAQAPAGWELFARVKFTEKFVKDQNEYYLVPLLDSRIRAHEGQQITIKGHYIPIDMGKNAIVVSKYPYSMCLFCGGAGPESVAEVIFETKMPKLKPDQLITVTGKLALNDKDVMHMNFILKEAQLVTQ